MRQNNMEEWRDIKGWEGLYQVSSNGRVKSLGRQLTNQSKHANRYVRERILSPGYTKDGYQMVNLCKDGKSYVRKVHRLVADAFIPNPNLYPQINHKDGVRDNNNVDNLEWCTFQQNIAYSYHVLGRKAWCKGIYGDKHPLSRKVAMMDGDRILRVFGGAREAARELGYTYSGIIACAQGIKHSYKGHRWKYLTYRKQDLKRSE